ncbi:Fibronectin type III [Candidatus Nanopelagicaceae bacterium]
MAVKKKSAAKKAAPKKSSAKKSTAKKSAVKKSPAKKTAAKKKSAVKKTAAKKVVKKSAVKKTTAKKKAVKKSAVRKSAASQVVIPPVPSVGSSNGSSRVNVSTTPAASRPAAKAPSTSKPAAKSQGSSKALFAVLVGILLIGAFVISGSDKDGDDAPAPVPAVTETPEATAAPEETMEATESAEPAATTGEAPSRFIGNWKDSSKSVMVITWKAPAGDVKGYKVETRSNLGDWKVVSEVSATTFSAEFAKGATDGSTSFRVSAVYADGTLGVATPFGFAGQFE